MMNIKEIKQATVFPYAFFIGSAYDREDFDQIKKWCNANCDGQWMIFESMDTGYSSRINHITVNFHSRASHDLSKYVEDGLYPESKLYFQLSKVLTFELDTDAVAFKLEYL